MKLNKAFATLLTSLLLASAGCSDDSEVFYSISYPVVRIEAAVTLPTPEPEPEPEPEPGEGSDTGTGTGTGTDEGSGSTGSDNGSGTGSDVTDGSQGSGEPTGGSAGGSDGSDGSTGGSDGSTGGTDTGTEEPEEPVNPLQAEIEADVIASAPVQAGGRYTLDFTRYNRGPLTVETATDQGTVTGAFIKTPGATSFTCYFLEEIYDCTISAYTDSDGVRKVLLTVDLTALYQERYPTAGVTSVLRKEYTSTPAN